MIIINLNKSKRLLLISLITILIIGLTSSVFAAYTDNLKVGDTIKFTGGSWYVYKTLSAANNLDQSNISRYLTANSSVTIKSKSGNVLKIGSNEYIYYGSTASKYFTKISSANNTSTATKSNNNTNTSSSNKTSFLSNLINNLSKRAEEKRALRKAFGNLINNLISNSTNKSATTKANTSSVLSSKNVTIPDYAGPGYKIYYNNLTDKNQKVYRYLYAKKSDFINSNTIDLNDLRKNLGGLTCAEVDKVICALRNDQPEFAYIFKCCNLYYSGNSDAIYSIKFNNRDSSLQDNLNKIDETVNDLIKSVEGESDYNKITDVHYYIINHMTFDYNYTGTIDGFITQKGVCQTYAYMFKYVMNKLNIDCIYLHGTVTNSNNQKGSHAWNYVKVNGTWYGIDLCWDDPINTNKLRYTYFLKGSSVFLKNRTVDTSDFSSSPCPTLSKSNFN